MITYGGRKCIYLYNFIQLINITRRVLFFFSKNQHDYKCGIDFIEQFSKQEVNIKRLRF